MAYVGLIAPGMLNMNACKISLSRGLKEAMMFSIGASIIVLLQAGVALFFAGFLKKNPEIIDFLKYAGILVFFLLAIFFFIQARKELKMNKEIKKGNPFLAGIGLSSINMLSIPYYLGLSSYGETKGWIKLTYPDTLTFVIGAAFGVFALLATYSYFAKVIMEKSQFLAKNTNYILAGLFLILGVITLIQVL